MTRDIAAPPTSQTARIFYEHPHGIPARGSALSRLADTSSSGMGPLGRLGVWVTDHARLVTIVWLLTIVGLGVFAPQVEHNLSGAGWQANGSESVEARELARQHFGGNASSAIQVAVATLPPGRAEGERARPRQGHRSSTASPASQT